MTKRKTSNLGKRATSSTSTDTTSEHNGVHGKKKAQRVGPIQADESTLEDQRSVMETSSPPLAQSPTKTAQTEPSSSTATSSDNHGKLTKMVKPSLVDLAKSLGYRNLSSLNKGDLISLIEQGEAQNRPKGLTGYDKTGRTESQRYGDALSFFQILSHMKVWKELREQLLSELKESDVPESKPTRDRVMTLITQAIEGATGKYVHPSICHDRLHAFKVPGKEGTIFRFVQEQFLVEPLSSVSELCAHLCAHLHSNWLYHIRNGKRDNLEGNLLSFKHHFLNGVAHWNDVHTRCIKKNHYVEYILPDARTESEYLNLLRAIYTLMKMLVCQYNKKRKDICTNPGALEYKKEYEVLLKGITDIGTFSLPLYTHRKFP